MFHSRDDVFRVMCSVSFLTHIATCMSDQQKEWMTKSCPVDRLFHLSCGSLQLLQSYHDPQALLARPVSVGGRPCPVKCAVVPYPACSVWIEQSYVKHVSFPFTSQMNALHCVLVYHIQSQ
ncbi:hypothetical protein ILYODFUR_008942 [Ilyodon furcidens]|uniref:Uncharacterized protein n=1 Tax=Ilyodon furcidens TaxID=33524 RepID=A0ABV0SVD6_9TELE